VKVTESIGNDSFRADIGDTFLGSFTILPGVRDEHRARTLAIALRLRAEREQSS
jgi:hypothetical protein